MSRDPVVGCLPEISGFWFLVAGVGSIRRPLAGGHVIQPENQPAQSVYPPPVLQQPL
jgi:hypothetical protein